MSSSSLQTRIQQGFQEQIDESKLLDCMQCGFCLPSCPTYLHSNQNESHSPRGRIAIMKAVRDGVIPFDDSVEESLDLCLGCRACEPACPAGVEYGHLLESARDVIQGEKKKSVKEKVIRKVTLDHMFTDAKKMNRATSLLRFYQNSGLQTITRNVNILSFFPDIFKDMEKVLPKMEKTTSMRGEVYKPKQKKIKVGFFTGCLMETIFAKTNQATVEILRKLGCEVWVPENQVCCGALHGHSGEMDRARENAKRNIDSLLDYDVDYIVNNAGGCGAFLTEYDHLFKDNPEYAEKSKRFSSKMIDISSLMYQLGVTNLSLSTKGSQKLIVTYQDSCHLRNVNHVIDEPREILKSIENVDFVELKGADQCCGSAGVYNLIHTEMSQRILEDRMANVKDLGANIVITTNPGCLLQMSVGIEKSGLTDKMKALHIVDFINEYVFINENIKGGDRNEEKVI